MIVSVVPIGNSRGVRFPKYVLDSLLVKDKMDMEVTERGILLTPVHETPREGWRESLVQMHQHDDDVLEEIPASEGFEWEW